MMLRINKSGQFVTFNMAINAFFGSSGEGNCSLRSLEAAVCGVSEITYDADGCAAIKRREESSIVDGHSRATVCLLEFEERGQ